MEITASVWQGSVKKGAATVAWDSTAGRFKLTVPDTAISLGGSYAIKIETKFLKTVHASSAALTVSKSADAAAFYISGLAAAGTYPVAVEGPVGPRKSA